MVEKGTDFLICMDTKGVARNLIFRWCCVNIGRFI